MARRTITGTVVSSKPDKTIVVAVSARKTHPVYKKQYTFTSKIMAHDEANDARDGDRVLLEESRPLSAHKHFVLKKIVERAGITHKEDTPEALNDLEGGKA